MQTAYHREYVRTPDLASVILEYLLDHPDETIKSLARRAGVDSKALRKVLAEGARQYQTIFLADKMCTSTRTHLHWLESVWRHPTPSASRSTRSSAPAPPRRRAWCPPHAT
jgi:hypothetical protein